MPCERVRAQQDACQPLCILMAGGRTANQQTGGRACGIFSQGDGTGRTPGNLRTAQRHSKLPCAYSGKPCASRNAESGENQ